MNLFGIKVGTAGGETYFVDAETEDEAVEKVMTGAAVPADTQQYDFWIEDTWTVEKS